MREGVIWFPPSACVFCPAAAPENIVCLAAEWEEFDVFRLRAFLYQGARRAEKTSLGTFLVIRKCHGEYKVVDCHAYAGGLAGLAMTMPKHTPYSPLDRGDE
jgi:hypothetical protein